MGRADDLQKEKICFKKQLARDEAIRLNKVAERDNKSSSRLLVVLLKIPATSQAMENLLRQAKEPGLHFNDYTSLRK